MSTAPMIFGHAIVTKGGHDVEVGIDRMTHEIVLEYRPDGDWGQATSTRLDDGDALVVIEMLRGARVRLAELRTEGQGT